MAQYIIRFDDLYSGMEESVLNLLLKFILNNRLPAILGVVPNWQDECDIKNPVADDVFWDIIRRLQQAGCEISLHGYCHKLFEHPSLLQVNSYGEFAGLAKEEQRFRIREGKRVLEEHGIKCRAFMAPAHSFDDNTLDVLLEQGIEYVTDGKSLFPYKDKGLVFIPQISSNFKTYPFGLITICLHPQWLADEDYKNLEKFLIAQRKDIISFEGAINYYNNMTAVDKIIERLTRSLYSILRKAKRLAKK